MRALESWDDAFGLRKQMEGCERFRVRRIDVLDAAGCPEEGVLWTDRWIIQACSHRMRLVDLSVTVLEHEGFESVQHALCASADACGVPSGLEPFASSLDPVHRDART